MGTRFSEAINNNKTYNNRKDVDQKTRREKKLAARSTVI
jgi:hypothetical protein